MVIQLKAQRYITYSLRVQYVQQSVFSGFTAIAHNAKGYDAQFLIQYLTTQEFVIPKVVPRGLSLLSVEAFGIRVIDSFCFLPMGLSALPHSFGESELKKGILIMENYVFYPLC